jgi:hypothetical protein
LAELTLGLLSFAEKSRSQSIHTILLVYVYLVKVKMEQTKTLFFSKKTFFFSKKDNSLSAHFYKTFFGEGGEVPGLGEGRV